MKSKTEKMQLIKNKSFSFKNNKNELKTILKNYGKILKEMNQLQKNKILEEKQEFEQNFVNLNCKIQNLKKDILNSLDSIQFKNDQIDRLDQTLIEKNEIIRALKHSLPN